MSFVTDHNSVQVEGILRLLKSKFELINVGESRTRWWGWQEPHQDVTVWRLHKCNMTRITSGHSFILMSCKCDQTELMCKMLMWCLQELCLKRLSDHFIYRSKNLFHPKLNMRCTTLTEERQCCQFRRTPEPYVFLQKPLYHSEHPRSETCSLLSTAETTHLPTNCNWYQSTSQLPVDCLAAHVALKPAND